MMADLFSLLSNTGLVEKREIVEGLNPPSDFMQYVSRFFPEEIYNLNENSLLYKILFSILGDAGVLGVKKTFLAPKLYSSLMGTNFNDIDSLFSNVLQLPRVNTEVYSYDPFNQLLTEEQWASVRYKDSSFKNRTQDYMRYFQYGNSLEGIELLAKSALGNEVFVQERWQYLDDINSDEPIGIQDVGITNAAEEITILSLNSELKSIDRKRVSDIFDRLGPANSIVTIDKTFSRLNEVSFSTTNINSSSNYFTTKRKVIGNSNIDYSYTESNNWIESNTEKTAPFPAFSSVSESIDVIPIYQITSSTYHTGAFNTEQTQLFSHLNIIDTQTITSYTPDQAICSNSLKGNQIISPWIFRPQTDITNYVIDDSYPIGYFADKNYSTNSNNKLYWASEELPPTTTDYLEIDFTTQNPVNSIEFEICQKPIDIKIYYWALLDENNNTYAWQEVNYRTDIENDLSVFYLNTRGYDWQYLNPQFDHVDTTKLKIEFERRSDPFPLQKSLPFNWSVEIRNLKVLHLTTKAADFMPISGIDVLGNSYRTELVEYSLDNLFNKRKVKYWKSQVNPTKFAVEALYFDIRKNGNASLIDEIFLDPITPGCLLHIYYSDDDTVTDWDYKLWDVIPRHYTLKKGLIKLPETLSAKYIKLEFTNLQVTAYDFANTKNYIRYRMYPTWVEELTALGPFNDNNPLDSNEIFSDVNLSFINTGIVKPAVDKLTDEIPKSNIDYLESKQKSTVLDEYQIWKNPDVQNIPNLDKGINIYPNRLDNLYSNSLLTTITPNARNAKTFSLLSLTDTRSWDGEIPLVNKNLISLSTKQNRYPIQEEKTWPEMWFMKKCRHQYKIVESPRTDKIGYYVAIKDIKFYKTDKTLPYDDFNYMVNLSDSNLTESNNFVLSDWKWGLDTSTQIDCGSNNIVHFGSENFDGVAF
jgi:hypothetical protein